MECAGESYAFPCVQRPFTFLIVAIASVFDMAQQFFQPHVINLVCFCVALMTSGYAQLPPEVLQFQKTYEGHYAETPEDLLQTRDHGYLMLGNTFVRMEDSLPLQEGIRLTRLDEDGSVRWTRAFGGQEDDRAWSAVETHDGGFLVAGQTESHEAKKPYAYLLKTDSLGRESWSRVFTAMDGAFWKVLMTPDSNYLAVGHGPQQLFALKISQSGSLIWTESYQMEHIMGPLHALAFEVGTEGEEASCFTLAGTTSHEFFLMQLDDEGNARWVKAYKNEAGGKASLTGLARAADGGFMLAGTAYERSFRGAAKVKVIKTAADGQPEWARLFGGEGQDEAYGLTQVGQFSFAVAGHTDSYQGNGQLFVLPITANGSTQEALILGGTGNETGGQGLLQTSDGGLALLGKTNGFHLRFGGYYLVKMDERGHSGARLHHRHMQMRRTLAQADELKAKQLPARFQRSTDFVATQTEVQDYLLTEKLVCGNVRPVFNPLMVVKAKARSRDSLALVALYESTNGPQWNTRWDLRRPMSAWESIQLDEEGRVMSIVLISNRLSGTLPPELGNLSKLKYLWLAHNQLHGTIPIELGKLSELRELALHHNHLSGGIPVELATLSKLTSLRLDNNQLEGNIPAELGNLTKLQEFRVNNNRLTGDIPPELSNLPMTAQLDLSNNQFSGGIPKAIFQLQNARMANNPFAPHAKAKLAGEMSGRYTYSDVSGDSYVLILNDETQRFTLMKGSYGDEGGEYVLVKGTFEWNEKGVFLHGELLEVGLVGDNPQPKEIHSEAYQGEYALEFEEDQEGPMKVKLFAFDTELQLEKDQK